MVLRAVRCAESENRHENARCKNGKRHKTCSSALCTMDDASSFLVIRLGPKTSECEKNVIVISTVTSCEKLCYIITRFQQSRHFVSKLVDVIHRRHVDSKCTTRNVQRVLQPQKCMRSSQRALSSTTSPSGSRSPPSEADTRTAADCPRSTDISQGSGHADTVPPQTIAHGRAESTFTSMLPKWTMTAEPLQELVLRVILWAFISRHGNKRLELSSKKDPRVHPLSRAKSIMGEAPETASEARICCWTHLERWKLSVARCLTKTRAKLP